MYVCTDAAAQVLGVNCLLHRSRTGKFAMAGCSKSFMNLIGGTRSSSDHHQTRQDKIRRRNSSTKKTLPHQSCRREEKKHGTWYNRTDLLVRSSQHQHHNNNKKESIAGVCVCVCVQTFFFSKLLNFVFVISSTRTWIWESSAQNFSSLFFFLSLQEPSLSKLNLGIRCLVWFWREGVQLRKQACFFVQGAYYHCSREEAYTQFLWGAYCCTLMLNSDVALNFPVAGLSAGGETLEF